MGDVRLDEFDKTEWWDVARRVAPGLSWDEYEEMWNEKMAERAKRARMLILH